jgi:hypothetical protein
MTRPKVNSQLVWCKFVNFRIENDQPSGVRLIDCASLNSRLGMNKEEEVGQRYILADAVADVGSEEGSFLRLIDL